MSNRIFTGVEYEISTRGSGKYHKVHCPDCDCFIHFTPDREECKRSCRICQAKWSIGVGSIDARGNRVAYILTRIRPGSHTHGDDDQRPTPDADKINVTELSNDLKFEFEQRLERMITRFDTEITAVKSGAFAGFLREMTEKALAIGAAEAKKFSPIIRNVIGPVIKDVMVEGARHYAYDDVLEAATAIGQALLVGPAGSGKSSMCSQMAADLDMEYGYLACTEGLSEAHILGRMDINGTYIPSDFVRIFEDGGLFLFDEVDAMDANTALAINEALSNGMLSVPNRPSDPIARKHPTTIILCAANTFGTGADATYVGRNHLDAAFLDRFVGGTIIVGYDLDRERAIAAKYEITPLLKIIHAIRGNVEQAKIRRPVTTRWVLNAGKLHQLNPKKYTQDVVLKKLLEGWTQQEIAKAMAGVAPIES